MVVFFDVAQADIGSGWESPGTAALWGRKPAGTADGRLGDFWIWGEFSLGILQQGDAFRMPLGCL